MSGRKAHTRRKQESRDSKAELAQLHEWLDAHGVPAELETGEELTALGRVKTLLAAWKRKHDETQTVHEAESHESADPIGSATEAPADQACLGAEAGAVSS